MENPSIMAFACFVCVVIDAVPVLLARFSILIFDSHTWMVNVLESRCLSKHASIVDVVYNFDITRIVDMTFTARQEQFWVGHLPRKFMVFSFS
jgi:hypothetical protein